MNIEIEQIKLVTQTVVIDTDEYLKGDDCPVEIHNLLKNIEADTQNFFKEVENDVTTIEEIQNFKIREFHHE